ncbi:MAG: hypothetical protein ACKVU2_13920 [Saprospiraceae bacterium]
MTRFFKFSVAAYFFSAFLLAEARGQKVTDVSYFPDGNRIVLTYNISKNWVQLPNFLRRKVWILPALEVPGQRLNFDTIKAVSGDVGLLERPQPGSKIMVWDFSKDLNQLPPGSRLTAKLLTNRVVRNRVYTRYFVAGWSGATEAPFGVYVAQFGLWGWYARGSTTTWPHSDVVAQSLFSYQPPCSSCTYEFDSETAAPLNFYISGGLSRKLTKWNYLLVGMGLYKKAHVYTVTFYNTNAQPIGQEQVTLTPETYWTPEIRLAHRFNRFFAEAGIGLPLSSSGFDLLFPTFSLGYAFSTREIRRF